MQVRPFSYDDADFVLRSVNDIRPLGPIRAASQAGRLFQVQDPVPRPHLSGRRHTSVQIRLY